MTTRREILADALNSENELIRLSAAEGLEMLELRENIDPMIEAFNNGDKVEKLRIVYAVSKLKGDKVLEFLKHAMKDPVEDVRAAAIREIGNFFDPKVISALTDALQDKSEMVVREAVASLGYFRDVKILAPLMHMLKNADHGIIERALEIIGRFADKRTEEAMLHFATKGTPYEQSIALKVLSLME